MNVGTSLKKAISVAEHAFYGKFVRILSLYIEDLVRTIFVFDNDEGSRLEANADGGDPSAADQLAVSTPTWSEKEEQNRLLLLAALFCRLKDYGRLHMLEMIDWMSPNTPRLKPVLPSHPIHEWRSPKSHDHRVLDRVSTAAYEANLSVANLAVHALDWSFPIEHIDTPEKLSSFKSLLRNVKVLKLHCWSSSSAEEALSAQRFMEIVGLSPNLKSLNMRVAERSELSECFSDTIQHVLGPHRLTTAIFDQNFAKLEVLELSWAMIRDIGKLKQFINRHPRLRSIALKETYFCFFNPGEEVQEEFCYYPYTWNEAIKHPDEESSRKRLKGIEAYVRAEIGLSGTYSVDWTEWNFVQMDWSLTGCGGLLDCDNA